MNIPLFKKDITNDNLSEVKVIKTEDQLIDLFHKSPKVKEVYVVVSLKFNKASGSQEKTITLCKFDGEFTQLEVSILGKIPKTKEDIRGAEAPKFYHPVGEGFDFVNFMKVSEVEMLFLEFAESQK